VAFLHVILPLFAPVSAFAPLTLLPLHPARAQLWTRPLAGLSLRPVFAEPDPDPDPDPASIANAGADALPPCVALAWQ
jgi:hypothetical protein